MQALLKPSAGVAQAQDYKPSGWRILDGLLAGHSVTSTIDSERAKRAAEINSERQLSIQDQLLKALIPGAAGAATPAAPAAPPAAAPGRIGVPALLAANPPAAPVPAPAAAPAAQPIGGLTNLRDAAPVLAAAQFAGVPGVDKLVDLLDKVKPSFDIAPNGAAYDKYDPKNAGRVFPKLGEGQVGGADGVSLAPGYVDAVRQTAAATEGAKADLDVIPVQLRDGRTVQMPRSQYIALRQTGQAPDVGVSQAPGERAYAEAAGRGLGGALTQIMDVPQPDGSSIKMSVADYLALQGLSVPAGGLPPAPGARAAPRRPAMGVSQTPGDRDYQGSIAKDAAAQFKGYVDRGATAPTRIAQFDRLEKLLGDFEGGKLSGTTTEIYSALNSLGMGGLVPKDLPNRQAAQALSANMLLTAMGGSLGVGVSNTDRDFLEKTIPGLGQSAGGRRQMIQYGKAVAGRDRDVSRAARGWQNKYGRIDALDDHGRSFEENLMVWSAKHPLFAQ
ncbi:hypothetical protein [Caulobacter rhizosphaerae]|uniref:hypothetical protein n=1 Tax=Caulobacter rhizosphaerae TaxID=2010972 RepID=UPI0013D121F7|nr:hypothetical protein [Caulobacter rhizosphaerae]